MSTPSQTPAARRGSAQRDPSAPPIAWPILIIDRDDRFVHVLGKRDFDFHHHEPPLLASPPAALRVEGPPPGVDVDVAPTVPVDFFDRDGRRLRPVVAADFGWLGLEATNTLAPTGDLMQRLDRAIRWALAQVTDLGIESVIAPELPHGDYGDYLDDLQHVFGASANDGSAWHNLIHVIT